MSIRITATAEYIHAEAPISLTSGLTRSHSMRRKPQAMPAIRGKPTNLVAEPSYPGLETVCFSIRFPDWTIHMKTERCEKDWPHAIAECGEWIE